MKIETLFITLSLIVAGIGSYVLLTGHWATNIGDVGEKLKCLCDQEKFCQSFTNVPQTLNWCHFIKKFLHINHLTNCDGKH